MESVNKLAGLALAAYVIVALAACSKTDNGSAAAVTPGTCTQSWDGQLRDQNGNICNSATMNGQCAGATFINNQYYVNGVPTNCGGSQYVIPPTGWAGNQQITGCQQWNAYYPGHIYVPVNIGGGQLMCVDYSYLQSQQYGNTFSSYNSSYNDPNYWYSNPPSAYQCDPYYGCSGGGYGGGYGSQCSTNINLGFDSGSFGAGLNLCF